MLQLGVPEHIQLAQDLWDSIAAESEHLPVFDVQRLEVLSRSEDHRRSPHEAIPLDEALERIEHSPG